MIKSSLKGCKNQLRQKYKSVRGSLSGRAELNKAIFDNVVNSSIFKSASTVYAYVSLADEADTIPIIKHALQSGKRVAVPYCVPNTSLMEFYYIDSISRLKKGAFGVLEPNPADCETAADKNALVLVPALSFDKNGFRLGYGKGYYDRYLANHKGVTVGLCFSRCLCRCILRGKYDRAVDYIITDKFTKFIAK